MTNATPTSPGAERAIRPRTTLHVLADLSAEHGGSVRAVVDLCRALGSNGIRCEIASLRHPKSRADADAGPATRVHLFRAIPPRRLGNSVAFARWLSKNVRRYELLEIHEVFRVTTIFAALIAHRNNVPYLVHPHGSLDPFDLRKHRRAKQLLAPLFRHLVLNGARGVVFTSAREQREANTFSSHVPRFHAAPVILAETADGERSRFRTRLGIADDAFVLLFMSRIDYKKGLLRTLRGLHCLVNANVPVELVVAGSGEPAYERLVRREVARLQLERVVRFVGFLDGQTKADALAAADALILVSDNENFGIIVVEALRAGLPVIISDRVAIASELSRTGAALVVPADDHATAVALHRAAGLDSAARREWSLTAKRVAGRLYDSDSVVRAQLALRRRVTAPQRSELPPTRLASGSTLRGVR